MSIIKTPAVGTADIVPINSLAFRGCCSMLKSAITHLFSVIGLGISSLFEVQPLKLKNSHDFVSFIKRAAYVDLSFVAKR